MNNSTHYIDHKFRDLAGHYNPLSEEEMNWMQNVIDDMKRGNIKYRIRHHDEGYMVQRTGMLVHRDRNDS